MKKHLTALLLTALASSVTVAQNGTINLNGKECPIDTIEHWQAGPGILHTAFSLTIGTTKHNCYMLDIDLTNPYNTVEEYQSASQMGSTEKLASAYQKQDAANHRTIGGVNCNFWVVASQDAGETQGMLGQPFAGTARNGVMVGEPSNWNAGHGDRGYVMIDRDKKVWIDNMDFVGTVSHNGQEYRLRDVNRSRVNPSDNEITLFNHYLGTKPTRSTDGTEVLFRTTDWRINGAFECEVTAVNTTGGTLLTEGTGALQGRGTGKDFLAGMQVGDRFQIDLGVISTNDETLRPDILQMVTGNALILANGIQTNRNTNEDYNNRNYPRTVLATNAEHNRLWMFVAEKPGMFTADMCAVLQQCGATSAAGLDGGGSAQMCLFGEIINPTTEGTARAVANSLWVFSTAPDDNTVTSISTPVKTIVLPQYGVFKPTFKGYNQYGVLISHDLPDVVLSCDASTGYIDAQGRFVCLGNGVLTATCQDATLDIQVRVDNDAKPTIRLDSVLVSDDTDYAIEVNATIGKNTMPLQPAALTWQVQDNTVCTVSAEGVLNGISNGKTWVYGTLGENTDSLLVHVEIPETRPLLWNTARQADLWSITETGDWQTTLQTNGNGGMTLHMNYTNGGRLPFTSLELTDEQAKLYSLPEKLEVRLSPQNAPLKELHVGLRANNATQSTNCKFTGLSAQNDTSLLIDLAKELDMQTDIAAYPVHLNYLTFYWNSKAKGEFTLGIEGIWLHYGTVSLGVESVTNPLFTVFPNPACDLLCIKGCEAGTQVTFYDLQGRVVLSEPLTEAGTIDISRLEKGNWLLRINGNTVKVIKK